MYVRKRKWENLKKMEQKTVEKTRRTKSLWLGEQLRATQNRISVYSHRITAALTDKEIMDDFIEKIGDDPPAQHSAPNTPMYQHHF